MKLATLCYVRNTIENSTLMILRNRKANDYHEGKWNGLGGKLEKGETPEDCVIREVKEETGLNIINPRMHGFITFPMFDNVDDWYVFVFTADQYTGTLIDSPEGTLEWIPDDELFNLNLWGGDRIFIEWLFKEKFFSARFVYENKKYISHEVNFY